MKIGIDFDDTIVKTNEAVNKFLKKHNVSNFNDENEKYEFYKKYSADITKEVELKENVKDILNKLSVDNELYIITARSTYYSKDVPQLVLKFIKENKLPIKETHFNCFIEGKANKCLELGIDLFIDDHVDNCLAVSKVGVDTLLFQKEYEGLKTVNNWEEIYAYIKG